MGSLAILVMHSGKWDDTNSYVDYTIEGVVFKEQSTFLDSYTTIAKQIGVDMNNKTLKIEYKVEESNKRMISQCKELGVLATVGENDCPDMIVVEPEDTNVAFVSIDTTWVISDESNKHVKVDQVYKEKSILKAVMERYAIKERFQYKTTRSNSTSYTMECYSKGCEWLMKASNINKSGMFRIRAFNRKHTCLLKDRVYSQRHVTSNLIGGIVKPKFVDHKRKYTPADIRKDVKIDLGVDVNYMLAWRAREKALKALRGTPAASYAKLPAYLYMMDITYPGPVVVVDGSHLRGPYNGTFVAASTTYGAGHIFPLAYGIIDSENDVAWTWFFEQLKEAYGERSNMCVVSDRNESIIKAVTNVYSNVPHYAYMRHLWNNVQKKV
nr:uncharacterized protein LOC101264628 [Solanum lycopersicum]